MRPSFRIWIAVTLAVMAFPSLGLAQGIFLPGGGAVQGGMAGVSTAAPLDAIGANYWNPAAIGRLSQSEVSIGAGLLFPDIHVSSAAPSPMGLLSGQTRSDNGVAVAPNIAVVYHDPDNDRLTYGMGLFAVAGGGVNFPGDTSNPILAPTGPLGKTVIGPIYSNISILQIAPSVAYQITDRLTIGFGPTIDVSMVSFNPGFFAGTNPPSGVGGLNTFPPATDSRPFWGGGFKVGLVYAITDTLDTGFGYSSPQWLEKWKFYSQNGSGVPETLFLNANLAAIYSWGIAYRGIDKLTLGVDLRYIDYKDSDLFGTSVKDGGLGWNSVFVAAIGANYQLNDRLAVRAGYQYNTNPITSPATLFNVQAPAITQHLITCGTTVALTKSVSMSVGYSIAPQNSISGPVKELTGLGVKLDASVQTLLFNLQFKFGGGQATRPPACTPSDDPAPCAYPASKVTEISTPTGQ